MIPNDIITAWSVQAPWPRATQIEQDLVLSRALVQIFSSPAAEHLALRGGTALHKLVLAEPTRYSEDIDLVYTRRAPIGPILDAIRAELDPWLGTPRRKLKENLVTMIYRFDSEPVDGVPMPMRLKVEINTTEVFNVFGLVEREFVVDSLWFAGRAAVSTYQLEELLGTKLRALYQRRKGRDLFDQWTARSPDLDLERLVECFREYVDRQGLRISQAEFVSNLDAKLADDEHFGTDIAPLLAPSIEWAPVEAAAYVREEILSLL